ncbi:hypothetical protein Tco_1230983, partial [Tanacetum coccineum]
TMVGVDVDTITMEQYLALSQENQAPGVVKPKIRGNVDFKIKSSEFFPSLLLELQKDRWTDSPHELSIPGISLKKTLSKGPIPGMRPAEALIAIQTMADHSQKWHNGTTSRKIGSSSNSDGLAALVNKLDNLGRDMKKLKERPPGYYTKIDNRPPYGEKRQSLEELLAKHQDESTRRSTEMEVWIKKL